MSDPTPPMGPNHFAGRTHMLKAVREELVGPSPGGIEVDLSEITAGKFPESFKSDGPYVQKGSREEILCVEPPGLRYGIGVLYPWGAVQDGEGKDDAPADRSIEAAQVALEPAPQGSRDGPLTEQGETAVARIAKRNASAGGEAEEEGFDLSSANVRRPNSMALSFLAKISEGGAVVVTATGGRYEQAKFETDKGRNALWWKRVPMRLVASFSSAQLLAAARATRLVPQILEAAGLGPLNLRIEAYSRPTGKAEERLITICLVNRTSEGQGNNSRSVFQSTFDVSFEDGGAAFLPYPKPKRKKPNEEEQSLDMLYREFETFAIGHGCGADWEKSPKARVAKRVQAVPLPSFEAPSITPEVRRADRSLIEAPMAPLAGLVAADDGHASLREIVDAYEKWIGDREEEAKKLEEEFADAAKANIDQCRDCLTRMREGLKFLGKDELAAKAFRWANEAILIQQLRSTRSSRAIDFENGRFVFDPPYPIIDPHKVAADRGKWRPFQIAFLLTSLRSAADAKDPKRNAIDLIWFPTGGGKTEAYFGLTAFSAFYRRLVDPDDAGVHVLMRYTLRLLTAQQFQRASGLICAMEVIRRRESEELGAHPFSIGIWLGGSTTPNSRADARANLRQLQKNTDSVANKFLVTKCPWCSAQMGPLSLRGRSAPKVAGYADNGTTVLLKCSDSRCDFRQGLPIHVVDDDIYEQRPTLVIGTVDKFAMLAWRPEARSLFGLDDTGARAVSPPGLIIQDELHLISGPLGSMAGLYEGVIEELCTDRRGGKPVRPKIVCSTATIRRFKEQARALFAREETALFPPPGLTAADSFFASYAAKDDGSPAPGRLFVGVYAPSLGSIQTAEVRAFTTLLQAPCALPEEARDPWWTTLAFLNSLREIGTAATLFQSDIPDRLKVLRRRLGLTYQDVRRLYEVMELTSRLRSDEVTSAIEALEIVAKGKPKAGKYPVDACLASNIIEVGVDIDRLSLLVVVGQPKSTSQYIQVAGRVGRRWWERPGLIVTIFGPNSSRDRSHYEKFRSYHERLYAQVEPTSVTPYSVPVLDRALHAVMAAYVRQTGDEQAAVSPRPVPEKMLTDLGQLLIQRVAIVDAAEKTSLETKFRQRLREWWTWQRTEWKASQLDGDVGLLTPAGSYLAPEDRNFTWDTPQSMRSVDAECAADITRSYLDADEVLEGEQDAE